MMSELMMIIDRVMMTMSELMIIIDKVMMMMMTDRGDNDDAN